MKLTLILVILFNFSLASPSPSKHYSSQCSIFGSDFKNVKQFSGTLCVFFDDGSFVQAGESMGLQYNSNLGEKIWSHPLRTHHQMNVSLNKKNLLVLHEEVKQDQWCASRFDVFSVLDTSTGKTLKSFHTFDHRQEMITATKGSLRRTKAFTLAGCDYEHFNAFYEIPDNANSVAIPAMQAGNYLLTSAFGSILILDKDLKKILWHHRFDFQLADHIHDVQVLKNGKFLIYSNEGLFGSAPPRTTINLYDPALNRIETLFPKEPKSWSVNLFGLRLSLQSAANQELNDYSETAGGVQLLDDGGLLLNINPPGRAAYALLIDQSGKKVWQRSFFPEKFQQVKMQDLTRFLENNRL